MNNATNSNVNAVVVDSIISPKELNALVVYGSEEELLETKQKVEQQLDKLTSGNTRSLGHVVEALRSHLAILNANLGSLF